MKTADPITDLEALPAILTIREISGVYRLSPSTIRVKLQKGTFCPPPWDRYPYRWRKEDVLADIARPRTEQRLRKHGFAARMRTAKATVGNH